MNYEEIVEICEQWGVDPKGTSLFNEDYIISRTGDLICRVGSGNFGYLIADNQLKCDYICWFIHLSPKMWYREETFIPAYIEALCRYGVEELETPIYLNDNQKLIIHPFKLRKNKELQRLLVQTIRNLHRYLVNMA